MHSMATANLKKSEDFGDLKFLKIQETFFGSRISINWNPAFQTSLHKISKVVFFRLTKPFFRNKKILFKEQLLFSFLCIVKQKKIRAIGIILKFFIFQKTLSKFWKIKIFNIFRIVPIFFFPFQYIKNWTKVVPWTKFFCSWKKKLLV